MAALCVLVAVSCALETRPQLQGSTVRAESRIELIADEYLAAVLKRYPEMGTLYSISGVRHDRLIDNSLEALTAWQAREDVWLRELDLIGEPTGVGSRDWVSYGVLREALEGSIAKRVCRSELWQASSATAWHTEIPFVFEVQPVDSPELKQQALERLRRLATFIDIEISNLRFGLQLGYSAPRPTVVAAPAEIRALLGPGSPLLSPGNRSGDSDFMEQVQAVVNTEVAPAVERFARFLEADYLPRAREEIGLGYNPNGASCYPSLVRYFATVGPAAEVIHQTGLEQMAGIHREMQRIIDRHFPGEDIGAVLRKLNTDPKYTFKTEEEVLQYSRNALTEAKAKMPQAFGRLPRADVLIEPNAPYRASATGEYQSSSEDGARPGIFYIAVSDPEHRARAIQQSVLYHETYPGHHLQGAIALELGDRVHPIVRYLWNNGYAEGWGLYSERLADELGLYSGPLDRLGMLSDQAARAARLVVDTGIHTMGWTQQQAVDYMLANTAWPAVDIESEVIRYIAWPGQANAYMLGMLEIQRLRDMAEAELGQRFDLRRFHDRVLEYGSITLPMLDASVRAWIVSMGSDPATGVSAALPVAE